ncbi:AEC family transporter [Alcaligenaceae bacterium]|nr:AEC family transporter [Alcaligenaceae bacterium]
MLLTLLNIVLPVFAIAALGFGFGRRHLRASDMSFINNANVMLFCPALVFSALLNNPVDLTRGWPLIAAGVLICIVPGILLLLVRNAGMSRPAFVVTGMFRNTGNVGIPLMMLAYGKDQLGDIVLLFALTNLLQFSLGLFILSSGRSRWEWVRNPNVWAAVLGLLLSSQRRWIPEFVLTTVDLVGQIAIPLMLFALGVRLAQDRIAHINKALRINLIYLLAGVLTLVPVVWLLPLTQDWTRLIILSAMLPPAVLNYLLCELYDVEPRSVAAVVLMGNAMSVAVIPLVVWVTLTWV